MTGFFLYIYFLNNNNLNNNIMDSVLIAGIALIIGAVLGFIVGVFVYRNNEDTMGPVADRLDQHEDNLQDMIGKMKVELVMLNTKIASLTQKLTNQNNTTKNS